MVVLSIARNCRGRVRCRRCSPAASIRAGGACALGGRSRQPAAVRQLHRGRAHARCRLRRGRRASAVATTRATRRSWLAVAGRGPLLLVGHAACARRCCSWGSRSAAAIAGRRHRARSHVAPWRAAAHRLRRWWRVRARPLLQGSSILHGGGATTAAVAGESGWPGQRTDRSLRHHLAAALGTR